MVADLRALFHHHATELVSHDDRSLDIVVNGIAVHVQIRSANPRGLHLDLHLIGAGRRVRQVAQLDKSVAPLVFDHSLHRYSPSAISSRSPALISPVARSTRKLASRVLMISATSTRATDSSGASPSAFIRSLLG